MGKFDSKIQLRNIVLALLLGSAFFACVNDIGGVLLTSHANRLLSGEESVKVWVRTEQTINGVATEFNTCDDNQVLIFVNYPTVADTLFRVNNAFDCIEAPLILQKVVYEVDGNLDDHFEYSLTTYENESSADSTVNVLDLTSQYLRIEFSDNENDVVEIYNYDQSVQDDLILEE